MADRRNRPQDDTPLADCPPTRARASRSQTSPGYRVTARSLALCRRMGWLAQKVEHWNPWAKRRQDLFGFADILAIVPGQSGCLLIQVTAQYHAQQRQQKILQLEKQLRIILEAGNQVQVWCWNRQKRTWQLKRYQLRLTDQGLAFFPFPT